MRFMVKDHERMLGQIRFKVKFLWFPKEIEGEVRWLERAMYSQEYKKILVHHHGYSCDEYHWVDRQWED